MLSEDQIETELGSLFKVDITSSRWAESCLLDLEYVQRMAEQFNLAPSESRYAIGMAILQAINDCLVPSGPHSPLDAWRDMIAAELNFVAALRKTIVAVLAARIDSVSARKIVEVFTGDRFSPAKLNAEELSTAARQRMVAAALRNLWVWKTWELLDIKDSEEWKPIIVALGQPGALSRDIIYESRDRLRRQVAVFLHSNQSPSLSSGFTTTWQAEPPPRHSPPVTNIVDSSPAAQQSEPQLRPALPEPSHPLIDTGKAIEARDPFEVASTLLDRLTTEGLSFKARQLARVMAAYTLEIESGAEPTPRLIQQNVNRALRWIGIEPTQTDSGDGLIAQLIDKQILRRDRDTLEFTRPILQYYLAAEYVAQPDCYWMSLHPRYRTIVKWATRLIAPQHDDYLNRKFLRRLADSRLMASASILLDVADQLELLARDRTPIVDEYITDMENRLNKLFQIGLTHFRFAIQQRLGKLRGESPARGTDNSPEPISDQAFANTRHSVDLGTLLAYLGFTPNESPDQWLRSRSILSHLIASLRQGNQMWRPACAAWLQIASLDTVIGPNKLFSAWLWRGPLATAREALAQIAIDKGVDEATKGLAVQALASDQSILHLAKLEVQYEPVILELEIITGRRLWRKPRSDEWDLVHHSQPDPF